MTQFLRLTDISGKLLLVNIERIRLIEPAPAPGTSLIWVEEKGYIHAKADFNQLVRDLPCIKF